MSLKNLHPSISRNKWLISLIREFYTLIIEKENQNKIGCALILYGDADTCKSTILRCLAHLFKPFQLWVGTQWLGEDNLRWDTCTRLQAITLVTEEMQWQSIARKETVEDVILKIKEQLTGAGANNRLSKVGNKCTFTTSALKYFFFSMNNGFIHGDYISKLVYSKKEYSKRFIVIDMNEYKTIIHQNISNNPDWNEKEFLDNFNLEILFNKNI